MILKNSVKSVLRTPLKTVLFLILTCIITVFLCTGVEMWNQSETFLKNLDNDYTTIATFEYVGDNYPDASSISKETTEILDSVDTDKIKNNPLVLNWDDSSFGKGKFSEFQFKNYLIEESKPAIIFAQISPDLLIHGFVMGYIYDVVYSEDDYLENICFFDLDLIDKVLTEGNYLIHGEFFLGPSANPHFRMTNVDETDFQYSTLKSLSPFEEIEGTVQDFLAKNPEYIELAEKYKSYNNSVDVVSTSDITALDIFHQQSCTLLEGRFFTESEALNNSNKIILTKFLASSLNLKVGDSTNFKAFFKKSGFSLKQYCFNGVPDIAADFTIVGIIDSPKELRATVYIPRVDFLATSAHGYKLGQATIKNGTADIFIESISDLLPENLIVSVFDQGYFTAFSTLSALSKIGMIITIVSIVVGTVFLALFAFLFVGKQRDTLTIMDSLGSGKKSLLGYILSGSSLIIAPAAILSGVLCYVLFCLVFGKVFAYIQSLYTYNLNFSSARLGIQHPFVLNFEVNPFTLIITCICVIAVALSFSSIMLSLIKTNPFKNYKEKKKKTVKHIKVKHSFIHIRGALKYAVISITRGKAKGIAVAVVSLIVVLFFSILNIVTTNYNDILNDVIKNTKLEVIATDTKGKAVGNLVVGADSVNSIYETGYVSDLNVSWETNYLYGGVFEYSNKTEGTIIKHYIPRNSYAYETYITKLKTEPKTIYTNNINMSPEFYYSNEAQIEFLEGYDFTSFGNEKNLCVVPYSFAESKNIGLGDIIRLYNLNEDEDDFIIQNFKIIGLFNKVGKNESIYCSFDNYSLFSDILEGKRWNYQTILKSASFTLNDASQLDEFKDALSSLRLSQVGALDFNRVVIQIQDKEFLDTVSNLNQTLRYLKFIYGAMFFLAVIIGFLVSYLLTVSRKSELAVMRSVGTGRMKVFLSFFIEQLLMCVLGALTGFLGMLFFTNATLLQCLSILAFVIIYLSGSALSIALMMKASVMEILSQKE